VLYLIRWPYLFSDPHSAYVVFWLFCRQWKCNTISGSILSLCLNIKQYELDTGTGVWYRTVKNWSTGTVKHKINNVFDIFCLCTFKKGTGTVIIHRYSKDTKSLCFQLYRYLFSFYSLNSYRKIILLQQHSCTCSDGLCKEFCTDFSNSYRYTGMAFTLDLKFIALYAVFNYAVPVLFQYRYRSSHI